MNFVSAVIKHSRSPFLMFLLTWVGIFVTRFPVEFVKSERVFGEMRAYPVEYYADFIFMAFIDKIFEIVGSSVSRSRRKHSGYLIPPTSLVRIFRYRQYFDMGITHLLYVSDEFVRQIAII